MWFLFRLLRFGMVDCFRESFYIFLKQIYLQSLVEKTGKILYFLGDFTLKEKSRYCKSTILRDFDSFHSNNNIL